MVSFHSGVTGASFHFSFVVVSFQYGLPGTGVGGGGGGDTPACRG